MIALITPITNIPPVGVNGFVNSALEYVHPDLTGYKLSTIQPSQLFADLSAYKSADPISLLYVARTSHDSDAVQNPVSKYHSVT